MYRRHFVKLSGTTMAALLLSRLTHAESSDPLMDIPDEICAQAGAEWFQLNAAGSSLFTFNDTEVSLKTNGNA